jgi:hypothetical protein
MLQHRLIPLAILALSLTACSDPASAPSGPEVPGVDLAIVQETEPGVLSVGLQQLNAGLAQRRAGYVAVQAEAMLAPGAGPLSPRIAFANDRTLRWGIDWVKNDPRRPPFPGLTWTAWSPLLVANGAIQADGPVDRAFGTWNASRCSSLRLTRRPSTVNPPSIIFNGVGATLPADIGIVGFIPGTLVDFIFGAGASPNIVGVTVAYAWLTTDGSGNLVPSDIDRDGNLDLAFAEIFFNDDFAYSLSNPARIDIESVVLHEAGHALGLGHFGKLVFDPRQLRIQASPRAVMNAAYLDALRAPLGSDVASLCSLYASW